MAPASRSHLGRGAKVAVPGTLPSAGRCGYRRREGKFAAPSRTPPFHLALLPLPPPLVSSLFSNTQAGPIPEICNDRSLCLRQSLPKSTRLILDFSRGFAKCHPIRGLSPTLAPDRMRRVHRSLSCFPALNFPQNVFSPTGICLLFPPSIKCQF